MNFSANGRFLDPAAPPSPEEISALLGGEAEARLGRFESFLRAGYQYSRDLKFPFGDSYGWGYRYGCGTKMLCYLFFEKGAFTVTLSIGKPELPHLLKQLPAMLPRTQELWRNRYPCGEGGWIHYRVLGDGELADVEKLVAVRKRPKTEGKA